MVDKSLYTLRPWHSTLSIAAAYCAILGALFAALYWPALSTWAAAFIIISSQQYALHIIQHDGMHGRLWPGKRTNDFFCRMFLSYVLFSPFAALRRKHIAHHTHLGTPSDPDRYYHTTLGKHTKWRFILFVTAFGTVLATMLKAQRSRVGSRPEGAGAVEMLDVSLVITVQAAIALTLAYFGPWYTYFLLWMAPYAAGVFACQNLRSFAEHAQPEADELADQHRNITYTSNRLERIFLAPRNMNYHAEHHMYPAVPYYNLPRLRQQLEAAGGMDSVEYRGSYIGFLFRYWLALPIPIQIGPADTELVHQDAFSSNT